MKQAITSKESRKQWAKQEVKFFRFWTNLVQAIVDSQNYRESDDKYQVACRALEEFVQSLAERREQNKEFLSVLRRLRSADEQNRELKQLCYDVNYCQAKIIMFEEIVQEEIIDKQTINWAVLNWANLVPEECLIADYW